MKKFTSILFSFIATSLFAQTQVDTPTNIEFGVDAQSSVVWDVKSNITVDGSLTFASGIDQYAMKINGGKTFTISSTGVVNMNSNPHADVNKQNLINLGSWGSAASFIIEEGGKLYSDKITITATNSQVTLNSADAIETISSKYTQIFFFYSSKLNMLGAGDYYFDFCSNANQVATLTFVDDVKLNVMGYINANNFKMNLVDFTETNSIFFASQVSGVEKDCIVKLEELGTDYAVSFYNGDTVAKTITITGADLSDFTFEQTTVNGVNGYLLSVAVPEPAEWAMIFGVIALGLAVYRRKR